MEDINKGISNTLAIALIFILMVVAGFGVFYISARVSQEQAIAPTAPVSEPLAAGTGCCKNPDQCSKNKGETCNSNCQCKKPAPTPTGYGENYTCTSTNCPSPCFSCNSTRTSCIAHPNATGCGKVSTGIGGDPNNCGGPGKVCPTNSTCVDSECILNGSKVTPLPSKAPTSVPITPITQPTSGPNPCDGKEGRPSCDRIYCHCLIGDDCGKSTNPAGLYECVNVPGGLRDQCLNQNRSWCLNQYGEGMTCCAVGYSCASKAGCVQTGPTGTPTKTTTKTPTQPPRTPTSPPPAVCVDTVLFIPQETATACTTDNDCSSLNRPEGQFCKQSTGKCNTWQVATAAQVSANGKVGDRVKAAFTASNTTSVEVKVNQGAFEKAVKNTATGKWDFVFSIPNSGNFNIQARYLRNQ